MSVVGFDFGTQNSRIAVVRGGGVDVICNEVSDRATPSMVSFDAKRRYAGDMSRTQQVGNFRNTVTNLPRLAGRLAEEALARNEEGYETCRLVDKEGVLAAAVNYRGQETTFTNTELVGMFFDRLKNITQAETKAAVSDVVISVPSYFSDKERRALMDAAEVAGLNCLRTVNDITAAAVAYGMMKTEIPSDKPRTIVIVDIGYSSFKAAVVSVIKGCIEVKAHISDAHLGGRDFDEVLVSYFANHFSHTRKVNIRENKKALLRLRIACERIKRVLSGIQMTRLELEALIDGNDFPLEATRNLLEELSETLVGRVEAHLRELLALANVQVDEIDSVEIIGGSTRIPAVKARIGQLFGKEVSTTLNADEAVSRGCALLCAMDSPLVRVREFKVLDVVTYPVCLTVGDTVLGEIPRGSALGSAVQFVIPAEHRTFPITVSAHFSHPELLPEGTPTQVAKFTLTAPKSMDRAAVIKVAISAQANLSGCIEISDASAETEAKEPAVAEEGQDSATLPPRIVHRCFPLSTKIESFRIPRATLASLKEAEIAMTLHDKLVSEIDDSRNALEEFIYDGRQKIEEKYSGVAAGKEREAITSQLSAAENWLYEEGADLGKEEYVKKLESIRALFEPLEKRLAELAKSLPKGGAEAQSQETDSSTPVPAVDMDMGMD